MTNQNDKYNQKNKMINNILLYNSGGGIGDSLQILPLINTLQSEFKNTKFYYLSAHENHFNSTLKDLNCEIESLNLRIKYFGFRWWHALIIKKKIKQLEYEKYNSHYLTSENKRLRKIMDE